MNERIFLEQEHRATGLKIFLASMKESHLKHLIKLAQDPSLLDLMGWDTFFELEETNNFIEAIADYSLPYSRKSQPLVFGVYSNLEDFPVGYAVLKGLNMDLFTAEIGVAIIDKKYRNKGYGRLALKRLVDYAFEELNIKIIGAAILSSNKTSINMCLRVGFAVREIMYESWTMPNGELVDMAWMEIKKT